MVERQFAAFNLIDPQTPLAELEAQALSSGPGIKEMEGILNLIHEANERNQGLAKFMPVFDVRVAEGVFGGGPGSSSNWDNRLDVLLQARYNLTDFFTRSERQRAAQSKQAQAHLTYQEIRGRLTMGVQEAYYAAQSGQRQMTIAEEQIRQARDAYERSRERLKLGIGGASPTEVWLGSQLLGSAQLNYLSAIRDYDKAQLRLLLLLGPNCAPRPHP